MITRLKSAIRTWKVISMELRRRCTTTRGSPGPRTPLERHGTRQHLPAHVPERVRCVSNRPGP